jgi:translation initiation factor 2 alpha subunit (eIF-2alpha)
VSVRAVAAIQAVAKRINQNSNNGVKLAVAAVVAPKYPLEGSTTSLEGIKPTLLEAEMPENVFVDTKLDSWRDLGLVSWPTVLFCTNRPGRQ